MSLRGHGTLRYWGAMKPEVIQEAVAEIRAEQDPSLKAQKLASLCSAAFRERGIELVVVGGSAIEFYTEGAYLSGDIDLCVLKPERPVPLRLRQEVMGTLGAKGGPRSWEVAGLFVDLLGVVEKEARTPVRQIEAPFGVINLLDPEELLVERLLVSVYPSPNAPARACARELVSVALTGAVQMDWREVRRLAAAADYQVVDELQQLVQEVGRELQVPSPYDPAR
jgi:hypothetical protein